MTRKSTKSASREWSGPRPRPKPCGRRLMASVCPSRMLAFVSIGWGYAIVSLSTKKIKGLHENDFMWRARSTECSIVRAGPSTASSDTTNPLPIK